MKKPASPPWPFESTGGVPPKMPPESPMTFDELYKLELSIDAMPLEELRTVTHDLLAYILTTGEDYDRAQCIINGTWPDADEVIKLAREKNANTEVNHV